MYPKAERIYKKSTLEAKAVALVTLLADISEVNIIRKIGVLNIFALFARSVPVEQH